ncbi:hypothetical protein HY495_00610 [Candidatus Woesearchaeota archaeon]|nr:hypothetical protein [Candidatus Woesearchaeota archaeon]
MTTTQYTVEFWGKNIVEKHTHYEAYLSIGPERATLIMRGDVADAFEERYGLAITQAERLTVTANFLRNEQRVEECQDPFKAGDYLFGTIASIDDIIYEPRREKD